MKFNYQMHMVAGNLTDDVKSTDKFASFSVALDVGYGDKKSSHFFNMTAFPNTFSEKVWGVLTGLKKGTNVAVEYEEQDGTYTNKDGVKVRDVKRIVKSFKLFFGDKPKDATGESAKPSVKAPVNAKPSVKADVGNDEDSDDLPF